MTSQEKDARRAQLIVHWAEDIIPAVFKAEDKINGQALLHAWKQEGLSADEIARRYTMAIAREIVGNS